MPDYQKELEFMKAALERMRLKVHIILPGDPLESLDSGFRSILGLREDYAHAAEFYVFCSKPRTIYKVLDQFMLSYIYFLLPEPLDSASIVIGPYLTDHPSREQIQERTDQMGIQNHFLPHTEDYYASIPVFTDPSIIMALVTALGDVMWGEDGYELSDVNYDQLTFLSGPVQEDSLIEQKSVLLQMQQMEERYAYENELMEVVSRGLTQRAEVMMANISNMNFRQRMADPLRNMKNYCIICNTLLRKAAEQGGVHPLYLDRMSGQYAASIENAASLNAGHSLIGDMVRSYCRLVRSHAVHRYSAIVQKTLTYIEANLSGDLSLRAIAGMHRVTPGYLSTLFHKETGRTLTDHINEERMKAALYLLKTTRMQIQSIAQRCGFNDPNYFSKLFRRCYGITPAQFRKDLL